jgi:hypothetical protein
MIDYRDDKVEQDTGANALEIRTSIAVAGAAGGTGTIEFYRPIHAFTCGCLVATMTVK